MITRILSVRGNKGKLEKRYAKQSQLQKKFVFPLQKSSGFFKIEIFSQLHDQMIHFQLIQMIYLQLQGHDCKVLWDLTPEYLKNSFTV